MNDSTFLVASGEPARRRDWARLFEAEGERVVACSGPLVDCPLARGELRCPLLDAADMALYDLDAVTAEFLPTLLRAYPQRSLLFARDAVSPGGYHQPAIKRFVSAGRTQGTCFGGD